MNMGAEASRPEEMRAGDARSTSADVVPPRLLGSWALAAVIVGLAIAQQAFGHIDGDVSWFITFAEKVSRGARAYVDISDPNPPAGYLVYMPAVVAARLFGFSAEAWTVVETFACGLASLALTGVILRRAGLVTAAELGLLRNAALWVLLVAAGFGFAEREHFAVIAFLPFASAAVARAEGRAIATPLALLAGVGGGVALCFKPYYILPLAAVVIFACVRRRSIAPLLARENLALCAFALAYGLMVWLRDPDYVWGVAALAIEVYAPARYALSDVVASPPFLFNAALLVALVAGVAAVGFEARAAVLGIASAGFLATYVIQAKIWFNHAYPGIALGVLACVALALGRLRATPERAGRFARLAVLPALICAPFMAAVTMEFPGAEEHPGLTAAVRAVAPDHPRIAALAQQLDVGHPLVRQLDGVWIGRRNALWVDNCVRQILATRKVDAEQRARLLAYAADERAELAEDVATGKPDVLLVETPQLREWALKQPEFAHLLDDFAKTAQAGDVEVWVRKGKRGA